MDLFGRKSGFQQERRGEAVFLLEQSGEQVLDIDLLMAVDGQLSTGRPGRPA